MKVTVLFFGILVEKSRTTTMEFENVKNLDALIANLKKQISGLNKLNYTVALNRNSIHTNKELQDGDVVALLPPFSGG